MPFLPPRAPTFLPGTLLPHGLSGSHCEPPSTLQLGCHPLQEVFPDLIRQDPSPSPCWCLKQYLTRRRHFSPVNMLNCLRPQSIITCFNNLIINPVASQVAAVVMNLPANSADTGDTGSVPGGGRRPGGGHSSPLQCSCLENPMARGAWWAAVHRVTKSRTRLKRFSTHKTQY